MVGSSLARKALDLGHEVFGKPSSELDFTNRNLAFHEIATFNPEILVIAAAKVGGIGANSKFPVDFLTTNLQIQTNLIDAAHASEVQKVIFLGSSCIFNVGSGILRAAASRFISANLALPIIR